MNIVHVVEATGGGVLSVLKILVAAQVARGYSVSIIYSRRTDTPNSMEDYFDKSVHFSSMDLSGAKGIFSLLSLRREILASDAHCVILHSSFAGFWGRLALLFDRKINVFYIPHGISFLRKDVGFLVSAIFILLERFAAVRKSLILPCSQSEAAIIRRYLPNSNIKVVENAAPRFMLPKAGVDVDGELLVICAARLSRQKRPDWFAEIARLVGKITTNIKFIWIGDGDENYKAILEQSGVTVTGWLGSEEVHQYLLRSSCYLSTSQWEGMPISLIEAQLTGIPIVASNCPGNIDVVEHGETGWVFDAPGDAVRILVEIEKNRELLFGIANEAARIAKTRFSISRYADEMDTVLRRRC